MGKAKVTNRVIQAERITEKRKGIPLRVSPSLYAKIIEAAQLKKQSTNRFLCELLSKVLKTD